MGRMNKSYVQVQCPTCLVREGERCRTSTGEHTQPHGKRISRWWEDYRAHRPETADTERRSVRTMSSEEGTAVSHSQGQGPHTPASSPSGRLVDISKVRPRQVTQGYTENAILRIEATALLIERGTDCEFCGAVAGKRCKTFSGNVAWMPHEIRRTAWQAGVIERMTEQPLALKVLDMLDNSHRYDTFPQFHDALREMVENELIHARDNAVQDNGENHSGPADGGRQS